MVASHPSLQLQKLHVLLIEPLTDGRLLVIFVKSPVYNRLLEIKSSIFVFFVEFLAETECGVNGNYLLQLPLLVRVGTSTEAV